MKFIIEPLNDSECLIKDIEFEESENRDITELYVPATIEQEGKTWKVTEVFLDIRNLKYLNLAEGIKTIGGRFTYLEEVSLPSTIEKIRKETFYITKVLDHLKEFPESLKEIGDKAFYKAFHDDNEDFDIHIKSSEIIIGKDAFNCGDYTKGRVKIVASKAVLQSIMGQPGALNGTAIEEITIPDNAKVVNVSNCPRLQRITIPKRVDKVEHLENLAAEIIADPVVWEKICKAGSCLAEYNPKDKKLIIPEGVETIAQFLLTRSTIKEICLPSSVKIIEYSAFRSCKELETIVFAQNSQLKEVQGLAFEKTSLKQVVFPDGMEKISDDVFAEMADLESVTFPSSMQSYGRPFVKCKKLKYIVFLADDPATAVYPRKVGKKVDWYVPDHMMEFVEAYIQKFKDAVALPDGIGAKAVKPLSKLRKSSNK